jgi:hypothetical protein
MRIQSQRETFALRIGSENSASHDYVFNPHVPHDWEEHPMWSKEDIASDRTGIIPRHQLNMKTHTWHPNVGETHARYSVDPRYTDNTGIPSWGANHAGTYNGHVTHTFDDGGSMTVPRYKSKSAGDHDLGTFSTPDEAKSAAEQHYGQTYGNQSQQPSIGDYDINDIMRDQGF